MSSILYIWLTDDKGNASDNAGAMCVCVWQPNWNDICSLLVVSFDRIIVIVENVNVTTITNTSEQSRISKHSHLAQYRENSNIETGGKLFSTVYIFAQIGIHGINWIYILYRSTFMCTIIWGIAFNSIVLNLIQRYFGTIIDI